MLITDKREFEVKSIQLNDKGTLNSLYLRALPSLGFLFLSGFPDLAHSSQSSIATSCSKGLSSYFVRDKPAPPGPCSAVCIYFLEAAGTWSSFLLGPLSPDRVLLLPPPVPKAPPLPAVRAGGSLSPRRSGGQVRCWHSHLLTAVRSL